MGNTDIVTAPLSDANEKNTTEHSTIFDDVFRTIAQKMPQLLIPLINEVFHTSYSEEEPFEQLRNEHYEKFGTVVTDSIIRIGSHIYHLEQEKGIDTARILTEDQSQTTGQNITNSKKLMKEGASVGIVTNNFHVFRALQIAKKYGLSDVCGIAADSTPKYLPNNMLREFFAEMKWLL